MLCRSLSRVSFVGGCDQIRYTGNPFDDGGDTAAGASADPGLCDAVCMGDRGQQNDVFQKSVQRILYPVRQKILCAKRASDGRDLCSCHNGKPDRKLCKS